MKIAKNMSLTLILLLSSLTIFMFGTNKVNALYYDKSYYDAISWIYTYQAPDSWGYNCLGWATGNMYWEWPSSWGYAATKSDVNAYLAVQGYKSGLNTGLKSIKIVAYGQSANSIVHFSKVTPTEVSAKWGALERFSHGISMDPYYADGVYGSPMAYYYK